MRQPPDTAERRPPAGSGAHDDGDDVSTTVQPAVGDLLALSDERDWWLARLLAAERTAYQRGFADGRAIACVALAEIEEHYAESAWWREYSSRLQRIIQADTDPSVRMRQVMAEIAADQKFARDARARLATKPWTLTPTESCVLRRIRFTDPGDDA